MTTPLWRADELAHILNIPVDPSVAVTGISIDTRTLMPGDLFFAIQGVSMDGHDFVQQAFEKGAAAAVIQNQRVKDFENSGMVFAVPDVLEALVSLGRASRERSSARIVAVTGSVGKTSTKEMLRTCFEKQGKTHASIASYNNHWGVPLTLARMPRDTDFGVFEIGMNHANEIRPLVHMVRPHISLVTTVEPVHLEFFASLSAIADAKGEIFAEMVPGGVAVLNYENSAFERLKAHALAQKASRVVSFGENSGADIHAITIVENAVGTSVQAKIFEKELTYHLGIAGHHMAVNSLGVLAVIQVIGADVEQAALALGGMSAPRGRGERTVLKNKDKTFLLIDESYNANPASMRAALLALGNVPVDLGGHRIAVLGPMRELGSAEVELHCALAKTIEETGVDLVYLAGDLMKYLYDMFPDKSRVFWTDHATGIIDPLCLGIRSGDAVMIKGSLSTQMGLVVKALQERFSGKDN